MGGRYSFFADNQDLLLALDDDGGTDIVSYARMHGTGDACLLFREWLEERIAAREKADEVLRRRGKVRLVDPNGSC